VADEVRSLAQRSAQAARDTASLIEASIVKTQDGSARVEQVAHSINAITKSVGQVKGLVDEVSLASKQQSQGIDQVAQAIAQMEKVTQTTAATSEESAAASEELSAQAETAMDIVRQLETLIGTRGTTTGHRREHEPLVRPPVMTYGRHESRRSQSIPLNAEELLPLEDTGTYGKF
jgi:methyl-accepting chemotaxis protein